MASLERVAGGVVAGIGCLWLLGVGVMITGAGLGVLALAKYVFEWSPF